MSKIGTYHQEQKDMTLAKLDAIINTQFKEVREFILSIAETTTPLTRLAYARDIAHFFEFLAREDESFMDIPVDRIIPEDLNNIDEFTVNIYLSGMGNQSASSRQRKLATLRSFFTYLFKKGKLEKNIMPNVDMPRKKEKPITRLSDEEVQKLLTLAQDPRDKTILILFLTTGMRVSELVGLNVSDVDLENASIRIIRKGGSQTILFLPNQCVTQLVEYLDSVELPPESALFLSREGERLGVRSVQNIVKHYAGQAAPLKRISPHKLRSTFGTNLYRATGDIYVVADVLGHSDVNTTKKHYAAISEDTRREAAKHVKL